VPLQLLSKQVLLQLLSKQVPLQLLSKQVPLQLLSKQVPLQLLLRQDETLGRLCGTGVGGTDLPPAYLHPFSHILHLFTLPLLPLFKT